MNFDSFVTNIYDPRLPDADDHLVSKDADPEKRPMLLKYIRDMIANHEIGPPMETNGASMKRIKADNLVGLYLTNETAQPESVDPIFTVAPASDDDEELEIKRSFHRKRRTNVYQPPEGWFVKPKPKDQLTIDDYSPARHANLVKRTTK